MSQPASAWRLDPRLEPFILLAEVERGDRFVRPIFARKLGGVPPEWGHHLIAFHARDDGSYVPAAYLHLWTQGAIGLVGGGCTDGHVIRAMPEAQRQLVRDSGGLLLQLLGFCFQKFEADLEAYFGHCGDARAREVDLRAGFRETRLPNLLVRPNRPLTPERYEALLRQAEAIGAF